MRVLQLGPYPPPHGGVQSNLVAIRTFLRLHHVPCAVINITRHRKPDSDEVYYPGVQPTWFNFSGDWTMTSCTFTWGEYSVEGFSDWHLFARSRTDRSR